MDVSKFKFWSIGLVLKDKVRGDDVVEIYPIEKIPDEDINLSKIIDDDVEVVNTFASDLKGLKDSKEKIHLEKKVGILATWASVSNYNRITPPDVCRYEYVKLYRVSNSDQFFWDTYMNDVRLRKREDVIHAYSNKDELDLEEKIEDMYFHRINTYDKLFHIHMPDSDGELTTYDISVDTLKGYLEIKDGKGNFIALDSDKDDLTGVILNDVNVKAGNNINCKADNDINAKAGNDVNIKAGNNIDVEAGNDIICKAGNDVSCKAGNNINANAGNDMTCKAGNNVDVTSGTAVNIETSTINMSCQSLKVKASETTFVGGTIKHDGISIDKTHMHLGDLGFNTSPPDN